MWTQQPAKRATNPHQHPTCPEVGRVGTHFDWCIIHFIAISSAEDLSISSDSMDDSMDTTNNTPEHTVPEVTNIQLETKPSAEIQIQQQQQQQQQQSSSNDDAAELAAADAAKDLFGSDLFHDVQAEEFWNDLLSTNTSEHNLNFFDNVQDGTRHDVSTVELDSSMKLEATTQGYFFPPGAPSAPQNKLAGL